VARVDELLQPDGRPAATAPGFSGRADVFCRDRLARPLRRLRLLAGRPISHFPWSPHGSVCAAKIGVRYSESLHEAQYFLDGPVRLFEADFCSLLLEVCNLALQFD